MIEYKYSLIEDLKMAAKMLSRYFWLKKHKLIFYTPTLKRFNKIRKNKPKPLQIQTNESLICYWTSSGTWGAYKLPNKIFIMMPEYPWLLSQGMNGN